MNWQRVMELLERDVPDQSVVMAARIVLYTAGVLILSPMFVHVHVLSSVLGDLDDSRVVGVSLTTDDGSNRRHRWGTCPFDPLPVWATKVTKRVHRDRVLGPAFAARSLSEPRFHAVS